MYTSSSIRADREIFETKKRRPPPPQKRTSTVTVALVRQHCHLPTSLPLLLSIGFRRRPERLAVASQRSFHAKFLWTLARGWLQSDIPPVPRARASTSAATPTTETRRLWRRALCSRSSCTAAAPGRKREKATGAGSGNNGPAAPARRGRGRLDRAGAPRAGRGPVTGRADDGERARNRELRLPRGTEPNGTEQNRTACGRTPPPRRRRRSGQIQRRVSISHRHHHPLTNRREKNAQHAWSKKKKGYTSFVRFSSGRKNSCRSPHTHTNPL